MNIQDVYNNKKEITNVKKNIIDFDETELSMSVFIWIVNEFIKIGDLLLPDFMFK